MGRVGSFRHGLLLLVVPCAMLVALYALDYMEYLTPRSAGANAPQLSRPALPPGVPAAAATSSYTIMDDEPQPSPRCLAREGLHHTFDNWRGTAQGHVPLACEGRNFTSVRWPAAAGSNGIAARPVLDLSNCKRDPRWGLTLGTILNKWDHPVQVPRTDRWLDAARDNTDKDGWADAGRIVSEAPPGVDWVYASCQDADGTRHTNLRVLAHAVPSLPTAPSGVPGAPSILVLLVDALSRRRFELDMPETHKFLRSLPIAHSFPHTSVFGTNTDPNVNELLEHRQTGADLLFWQQKYCPKCWRHETVFDVAQQNKVVTSVWDDYCPEHGTCEFYGPKHHKVCSHLLCNYGSDIARLFAARHPPGCRHGEWWYAQQLRYINSLWKAYPGKRKFHFGHHYGCHMERSNSEVCNSNDAALAAFLRDFVPANPDTIVLLTSDHGFHWTHEGGFNEEIAGELEHRTPVLEIVVPAGFDTTVLKSNTQRLVTHRDVHATLNGMLAGWGQHTPSNGGSDLMTTALRIRRSCREAGVPSAWCNCFRRARVGDQCWPDSAAGELCGKRKLAGD